MKIPGIVYIIVGIFISGLSGYIYKFVPKPDGTQNMSMTLFFFIGIIFIIIGFIKTFFKKIDKTNDLKYQKIKREVEEKIEKKHKNRVEEHLNELEKKMKNNTNNTKNNYSSHTNTYAKTHPYTGIKKDEAPKSNNLMILKCKRCGKINPPTANYCHDCGYRLI